MTLIVPSCNAIDQLVFGADRRLVVNKVATDNFNKIIQLGNTAVGSACGNARCLAPGSHAVQFDAFALLAAFFANRVVDQASITDFGHHLEQEHAQFIQVHRNGAPLNGSGPLFMVPIFYLHAGRIVRNVVAVDYTPQNGAVATRLSNLVHNSQPTLYGPPAVRNALQSGNPIFQALWAQAGMIQLLQTPAPFNTFTQQQTIDAVREIIAQASMRANALTHENPGSISPACDVVVLDQNGITVV